MPQMKLFDYVHYEDFGHEWYFQLLPFYPKFALIDMVVQWDDFAASEPFPSILFGIGPEVVFGFSIRYKRFQISCDFFDFQPRNLAKYRRWKSGDYR